MRHLISLKEQTKEDILKLIDLAVKIKEKYHAGETTGYLQDKTLIMLFQKTSTRTRLSFEAGMTELGGHGIYLDSRATQLGMADFKDEIQAIMRFGDVLMFRAKKAEDVALAASFNRIPVIDACSEKYHPCQALADLLTMAEHSGGIKNVKKITWLGVENNVSNTLVLAAAKLGIQVSIAAPEADPDSIDNELNEQANATGMVTRTLDLTEAMRGDDYVHTDTWMNMEFFSALGGPASGGENGKVRPEFADELNRRERTFMPYQLNAGLINRYSPNAKIMHCMPCHVGYEISRDAIDHPNAIIFDQAENRKHMQKAIMLWLLEKENI